MGIFDDAKTVMIGNKEVQSIITSNGGVIYEKPSGYKLTLTADKSIIQTNELCTLSATLTNNNTPMAGETIFFYDSNNPPISYSTDGSHDFTVNVGDAFKLYYTSQSTASNSYCAIRDITNSISIYVHKEGNVSITETNISRTTTFNSFSYLKLENGILSNGDGDTCDLSSYTLDFDLVRINNSGTVYVEDDLIGVAITNVNGVATVGYTGKGTGDLNIQADWEGRIQSEIFVIEDCRNYIPTSTTVSSIKYQLNNVADFGVLDTDGLLFSAILQTSATVNVVAGLCVVNNVQTSPISPYPSGYIDYRLFADTSQKGFGGGQANGGDYGMNTTSGTISTNTDYLFEMIFQNNQLTGRITQISNSTVVYEQTITPPKDYSNYHFALFLFSIVTVTYKDVKVKPL